MINRPLVILTLCFAAGIVLGQYFSLPVIITVLCISFILSLVQILRGKQFVIFLLLIFLTAGALSCHFSLERSRGNIRVFSGERGTMVGTVAGEPVWRENDVVFPLQSEKFLVQGEEHNVRGQTRVVLRLQEGGEIPVFFYGQYVSLRGTIYEPASRRNPGGFDYRFFLETQGMVAAFYGSTKDAESLGLSVDISRLRLGALQVKEKMSGVLRSYLPERAGNLLVGMLFGERRALDPDTERLFRSSGVSHLLAVSGLHVGLIAAFLFFAGNRMGLKGWQAFLLMALFLFAYIYICGLKPAMLRAFIMAIMGMGAVYLGRGKDLPTAVAFAALVTLVYNPLLLFSVGFQFSYAATLSIIFFTPLLTDKISTFFSKSAAFIPSSLVFNISSLIAVTLSAQLGVIPLTAFYFKEISLVALFSNMLILPVMALVLGIGLTSALLGLVFPMVGSLSSLANYPLLAYILLVAGKIGSLPFAYLEVFPPRILELVFYYSFLLFFALGGMFLLSLLSYFKQRVRPFHFIALLLIFSLFITLWGLPGKDSGYLEVVFLDVGQGDAVFIRTPQGRCILLDGGGNPAFKGDIDAPGRFILVPFLEHRRIKKLDMVIISHPHEDHYGGLFSVLEKFPVGVLVTNGDLPETSSYLELLKFAEKKDISREIIREGDNFVLGQSLKAEVLSPPAQLFRGSNSDTNNNSLVLQLSYKEVSFLFTGDIEVRAVEYLLKEKKTLASNVLKVPHHGGYLSNLPEFLDQVSPNAAVITVGSNSFGHPHPATLSALQERNVQIYRTDLHGAVMLKTDGFTWEMRTMLSPLSFVETGQKASRAAGF
ncbi:MAG: DNA internalization-related competence protein ComEC/Rec2 [Bacillota bacterium]|nr:DNA internalization-related competence protein ComEC/Rec2 [Bacillota bacterium]